MFNKLYEEIKKIIKENYKSFLLFFILFFILTFEFPYYISAPGGTIDTSEKIKSDSGFKMSGSLNMAYVSEIHGTIPTLIYSAFNKDWDIEKEENVKASNESIEDKSYRNHMLLKEANDTALLVAYKHSNINYKIENNKVYITYVDKLAKTDLKVKDQILKVDDKVITCKQDLYDYTETKKIGDKIKFKVKNGNKTFIRTATLIDVLGKPKVGTIITETFDINSNKKVKFNFKKSESGSSGGLMLTLTIYSNLNKIDLTAGKKIIGTGTIDENGNVGEISGIKYKLIGAVNKKADIFLVPYGENYQEARNLKNKRGYSIDIIPVKTFDEALKYLKSLD